MKDDLELSTNELAGVYNYQDKYTSWECTIKTPNVVSLVHLSNNKRNAAEEASAIALNKLFKNPKYIDKFMIDIPPGSGSCVSSLVNFVKTYSNSNKNFEFEFEYEDRMFEHSKHIACKIIFKNEIIASAVAANYDRKLARYLASKSILEALSQAKKEALLERKQEIYTHQVRNNATYLAQGCRSVTSRFYKVPLAILGMIASYSSNNSLDKKMAIEHIKSENKKNTY